MLSKSSAQTDSAIRRPSCPLYVIGDQGEAAAALAGLTGDGAWYVRYFASISAFLAATARLRPGHVLLDLDSAGAESEGLIEKLLKRSAVSAVIAQTVQADVERAIAIIRAGAADLLVKPYGVERLDEAVRKARLDDGLPRGSTRAARDPLSLLSNREREVLFGLKRGQTNKAIAAELGISHRTVEIHRAHLMRKLGANNLPLLLDIANGYSNRSVSVRPRVHH